MNSSSDATPLAVPSAALRLAVNGVERQFDGVRTLQDLLRALDLDPRMVVVELNRAIVRRPALADASIRSGDQVEIVHFVGGG